MYPNLLVVFGKSVAFAHVLEGVVFVDLSEFDGLRVSPLGVVVGCVEFHCLIMISGYLKSIHEDGLRPEGVELGLVGKVNEALLCFGHLLHSFQLPSRSVKEIVFAGVGCDSHGV